jgi:hypothetical protein
MVLGHRLDDRGVRIPVGARDYYHHRIQTSSEDQPSSYPTDTRGSFLGGNSAEVKNEWRYTSTPQHAFMAWYSFKAREQFYLYLTDNTMCNQPSQSQQ